MNHRTSLPVATLVALFVALPTTLQGAPGGQSSLPAGSPSATAPSAAEAARLAAAAADMAQRAAKLAAEAQQSGESSSAWRRRGESQGEPAHNAPAAYPTTATRTAEPAQNAEQNDLLRWRQVFATDEERNAQASGTTATLAGIGSDLTAPFSAQATAGQAELAPRTINDSEVVLAADAQYPETLAADSQYAIPANYAGCGDAYCGDMGCCPPRRPLFWVMGVEATFLNPDLNSTAPSLEVEDITFDRFSSFSADSAAVDSFYMSPRIWLGIQGCRWGTQIRYWHMQAAEFNFDGFFDNDGSSAYGIPDASYFSSSRLDAYTIDWEITRRFCVRDCEMVLSGGVRYALIQTDQSVTGLVETLTDPGDDETTVLLSGYGRGDNISRGTGLVLGLSGRIPLFPCSCINVFWNTRGSVMWGTTETYAESFANVEVFDPAATGAAASVNSAHTGLNDELWIGEFQLGLEWDYCLCCIPANAFVRVAAEYQRWDGGSGSSRTGSAAGAVVGGDLSGGDPITAAAIETLASADGPQLDLVGFTIGAGLTW